MVTAGDLVSLDAYSMYIKLCIDGMTSIPFSAKSLPIRYERFGLREEVVNFSRTKYGRSKVEIEEKISKWSNQSYSEKGNRSLPVNNVKKVEGTEEIDAVKP